MTNPNKQLIGKVGSVWLDRKTARAFSMQSGGRCHVEVLAVRGARLKVKEQLGGGIAWIDDADLYVAQEDPS